MRSHHWVRDRIACDFAERESMRVAMPIARGGAK
jgi:hypothetical protein